MIETEEQRRWWFAMHPEYSWSHRGIGGSSENEKNSSEIDPREVDEYVDNALKYETDEVVQTLLKSVKRYFGTEADSRREQQNLHAWKRIFEEDDWLTPAGNYADGGAFEPRMPTMDELSRWPREMVGKFFKWLDAIIQSHPLLMDPNAQERHHLLVKQFARYFKECGIPIDEFQIIMRAADHRLKPDGLHTGKGRGGDWNAEWDKFIKDWPDSDNSPKHQERIHDKLEEMKKRYRIDEKTILSPGKSRSW